MTRLREELGDDIYGVTVSDAGYFTLSTSYPSAVKSYKVTVGGKAYTLLVVGDMEAVSQAAAIVKRIFPMVLGITLLIAFFCAILASWYLVRPILRLSRVSRKMAALDFGEHCEEKRKDEIGVLAKNLNELSDSLSTALSDLRSANEELKLFFAAASHELKTPVTILKGHLGGMLEGVGEYRDHERYLQRSYEVTETLETMVKEILTISRMGTRNLENREKENGSGGAFPAGDGRGLGASGGKRDGAYRGDSGACLCAGGFRRDEKSLPELSHQCDPLFSERGEANGLLSGKRLFAGK